MPFVAFAKTCHAEGLGYVEKAKPFKLSNSFLCGCSAGKIVQQIDFFEAR
jgi:hypothetical protein